MSKVAPLPVLDWSKPIQFRNGKDIYPARVICRDRKTFSRGMDHLDANGNTLKNIILYTSEAGTEESIEIDDEGNGIFNYLRIENILEEYYVICFKRENEVKFYSRNEIYHSLEDAQENMKKRSKLNPNNIYFVRKLVDVG